ncbi:Translocation protein S62 [Cryptotrichosporon argae]
MPPADATHVLDAQKKAPADVKAVADFLRGKNGPKVRRGVLNGKRIDYFKSKTAIRTLMGPAYQKLKKVPPVKNEDEAKAVLLKCIGFAYFLRVEKPANAPPSSGGPKPLLLSQRQSLDDASLHAWFYDGSPLWTIVGGVAMLVVMLAGVMFPLWPVRLRIGVWYLSVGAMGVIGLFIVLAIVRLIFWCLTVLASKRAIWIFPNLFEDVGFVDSFIPLWAYDEPKKKKRRVGDKRSKKAGAVAADPTADLADHAEPGEPAAGPVAADTSTATSTAAEPVAPAPGLRSRQAATIEEIEDEDS